MTVPSVVGATQAAATSTIVGVGLTVTTSTASSATVAAGNVISQNPLAGASAPVVSPRTSSTPCHSGSACTTHWIGSG